MKLHSLKRKLPQDSIQFIFSQTRIIIVLECLTTFFLPLILTIFADISVLTWKSSFGIDIDLVSREKISGKNSETMKIVSTNSLKVRF